MKIHYTAVGGWWRAFLRSFVLTTAAILFGGIITWAYLGLRAAQTTPPGVPEVRRSTIVRVFIRDELGYQVQCNNFVYDRETRTWTSASVCYGGSRQMFAVMDADGNVKLFDLNPPETREERAAAKATATALAKYTGTTTP